MIVIVWTLADDRSRYIEVDPRRAGGALINEIGFGGAPRND